ncbi:MAG TPA: hypothetical protein VMM17_01495 [Gemmatimonadaceae bacterium]|nr:hypothetical protein [Gemmatimonadaceae bacterium]
MGLLLVIVPLADRALNWGSIQPGSAPWRFGAVGSLSEASLLPVLGLFLLFSIAHLHGSILLQRVLETVTLIAAVLTIAVMALFVLDALQMRGAVSDAIARFDRIVLRVFAGQLMALLFVILLPITSIRARRRLPPSARHRVSQGSKTAGNLQDTLVRPA